MKIILKFLLRNIKEKKFRTFLILLSVILSTALLFSTIAIPGTVRQMFVDRMTKYTGTSDIIVHTDTQSSRDSYFNVLDNSQVKDKVEYMIGVIEENALYKESSDDEGKHVYIDGYVYDDFTKMHNITFLEQQQDDFEGSKIIIGNAEASEFNLQLGSQIELIINGEVQTFTVYAIAPTKGYFEYNGDSFGVVVPKNTLSQILDKSDKVNKLYVKTNEDYSVNDVMVDLNQDYDDLIVKTTITTEEINKNIQGMMNTFSLMLVLVVFISIFIIYTSFKVITIERLPIIGTFRSIGATKRMTDLILLGESLIFGIIGGVIGNGLGMIILKLMMNTMSYNAYTGISYDFDLVFGIDHIIITFLFAVILSVFSALLPTLRVRKIALRDIIFNNIREITKSSFFRFVLGFALIVIPFIFLLVQEGKASNLIGVVCLILMGTGVVLMMPYITEGFIYIFERFNRLIFKNEGALAAKNLRKNKNVINNIMLLTIGLAGLIMINTVSRSVMTEIVNVFDDAKFDINFIHPQSDEDVLNRLKKLPGVSDVQGNYTAHNIKVTEVNDSIGYVWGIDGETYFDYWEFGFTQNKDTLLEHFNDGRNAILSESLGEKFGLTVGDEVTLEFKEKHSVYTIVGFANSILNNGNYIYIPKEFMREDSNIDYMSDIMVRTNGDNEKVRTYIEKEFEDEFVQVMIMDEEEQKNMESNNQMFNILTGFSIITMIIGIFGIFNNFMVSLISRKQSLAVYRSIGMSRKQMLKMLFIEAYTCGMIGGITGILAGLLFIMLAEYITKANGLPIKMHLSIDLFIFYLIGAIILAIVASISPALKTSKQNIIEGIKYE